MTGMRVDYIIAFHSLSMIYINLKTFVNVSDQVVNVSGGVSNLCTCRFVKCHSIDIFNSKLILSIFSIIFYDAIIIGINQLISY